MMKSITKILVFSDSHGDFGSLEAVVKAEKPQQIIHLGDGEREAERLREAFPNIPVASVPGNCDYNDEEPDKVFTICGKKIMITHGHKYGVKKTLLRLEMAAKEKDADIVLYGHTHIPMIEEHKKPFIMNPGSAGAAHFGHNTYGVIEIAHNGVIKMTIKSME